MGASFRCFSSPKLLKESIELYPYFVVGMMCGARGDPVFNKLNRISNIAQGSQMLLRVTGGRFKPF